MPRTRGASPRAGDDPQWFYFLSVEYTSLLLLRIIIPLVDFNNWQERFSGCLILLKDSNLMINGGMVASSHRHKTQSAMDALLPPTPARDPPPLRRSLRPPVITSCALVNILNTRCSLRPTDNINY